MIAWSDADRKLREAAQLWALARRLPHVPTEHERRLIAGFDDFVAGRRPICERDAAVAGMEALWERRDLIEILRAARKLPLQLRRDREVRTCIVHSRRLIGAVRRRHRFHRQALTALNDLLNEWDPIGVAESVRDEYVIYANGLAILLAGGADAQRIEQELKQIVIERMGLESDAARERDHANAIVEWSRRAAQAPG